MKNKKTVVVVIVIIVAVILLVVAGWLIYSKFFKKVEEKNDVPLSTDDSAETPIVTDTNTQVVASGPSDVKKFQDWMDIYHPNWVNGKNLNKGSGYGTYGPSTQKAWALWKADFLKPVTLLTPTGQPVTPYIFPNLPTANQYSNTMPYGGGVVAGTPIKVGDNVYSIATTIGFKSYGAGSRFERGGYSYGNFYKDAYVGKVLATNDTFKTLQVQNLTQPMMENDNKYTSFWVKRASVYKKTA